MTSLSPSFCRAAVPIVESLAEGALCCQPSLTRTRTNRPRAHLSKAVQSTLEVLRIFGMRTSLRRFNVLKTHFMFHGECAETFESG